MIVIYRGHDEVIVTELQEEHRAIREYFTEGGRNLDAYERQEMKAGPFSLEFQTHITVG